MACLSTNSHSRLLRVFSRNLRNAMKVATASTGTTETSSAIDEHLNQLETAKKRRDILHHRREIVKAVRADPVVEKAALDKKLRIPLDAVKSEWQKTRGLREVEFLAKYYGIFKDIFKEKHFTPTVWLDVSFQNAIVHRGNIIEPSECLMKPTVSFDGTSDKYHSLILVNPDGCYPVADAEVLHWMVLNAPGSKIEDGRELSYIPPIPWKGSGFHRLCLAVFAHNEPVDVNKINESTDNRLKFHTAEFIEKLEPNLRPVGLGWFQSSWDSSVSQIAKNLGIFEPMFEWEEFQSPKQLSKAIKIKRENNKYRIKFTNDDILLAGH
eukprot:gene18626-20504_t